MPVSVNLKTVHPRNLAAVRREAAPGAVGSVWGPALGKVWGDPTPDPADTETTVVYLLK